MIQAVRLPTLLKRFMRRPHGCGHYSPRRSAPGAVLFGIGGYESPRSSCRRNEAAFGGGAVAKPYTPVASGNPRLSCLRRLRRRTQPRSFGSCYKALTLYGLQQCAGQGSHSFSADAPDCPLHRSVAQCGHRPRSSRRTAFQRCFLTA